MQLVSTISNGRCTEFRGFIRSEIVVQQGFERTERILVLLFAGNKLPVIETDAIVEQQLDGRSNNQVAVAICLVICLLIDFCQAVDDDLLLLLGEMQCYIGGIGEKSIILHMAAERCAPQQVGMEQQTPARTGESRPVGFMSEHLPRSEKHQRIFLKIVGASAIGQIVRTS